MLSKQSVLFIFGVIFLAFAIASYENIKIGEAISCLGLGLFFLNLGINFDLYNFRNQPTLKKFFDKKDRCNIKAHQWLFFVFGWLGLLLSIGIIIFS